MRVHKNQTRLLFQELNENPYRRLNVAFFLMSVIPILAMAYILVDKVIVGNKALRDVGPILFSSGAVLVLGYVLAYGVIKNVIHKTMDYAARAKQADEMKSTFAMALAHDLKSPIATIKANISNVHSGLLGPLNLEQQEATQTCRETADRMNTMISELINTYIFEARQTDLKKVVFDLRVLLDHQHRELALIAREKEVVLTVELAKSGLNLDADREKIERAVNNLLSNSIKHTPAHGRVVIKAYAVDGFARVDFFNTGEMIPAEKLNKIFDKFERLNALVEGHGLGLSIAKDIIELHEGKIWAVSEPGQPNCFSMILSLAAQA